MHPVHSSQMISQMEPLSLAARHIRQYYSSRFIVNNAEAGKGCRYITTTIVLGILGLSRSGLPVIAVVILYKT